MKNGSNVIILYCHLPFPLRKRYIVFMFQTKSVFGPYAYGPNPYTHTVRPYAYGRTKRVWSSTS